MKINDLDKSNGRVLTRKERMSIRGGVAPAMGWAAYTVGMFVAGKVIAASSHNGSDNDYPIITDEVRNAGNPA